MFKSALHQVSGSIGSTALNMAIVLFTAKLLGAEGRGQITYLLAFSGLIQIATAIIGSSVMVFMLSKLKDGAVLIASFVWTVVIVFVISVLILVFKLISANTVIYLVSITILQSLFNNLLAYYASKIKFKAISALRILQPLLLTFGILALYYFSTLTVVGYWQILIVSFLPSFAIISFETLKHTKNRIDLLEIKQVCVGFLKLGGLNQLNNLMQYGSYRFAIWTISTQLGIREVGVFGLWLTVCDAIWLIPISLATVNQAYAAKPDYRFKLLNKYLAVALLVSILALGTASFLPQNIYISILGNDFSQLKSLIILSSPVVIAFSIAIMYAYYFSAKGLVKCNFFASGLGLIAVLSLSQILTEKYGLKGAVLANCISYFGSVLVLVFCYFKHKKQLKL